MPCLWPASPTDKLPREYWQVWRGGGQEDVPTLVFVLLFGSFQGFSFLCQYQAFSVRGVFSLVVIDVIFPFNGWEPLPSSCR